MIPDLVQYIGVKNPPSWSGAWSTFCTGRQVLYTGFNRSFASFAVSGGQLYTNVGDVRMQCYGSRISRPIGSCRVPADKTLRSAFLTTSPPNGPFQIVVDDWGGGTSLDWMAGTPMVMPCGPKDDPPLMRYARLVFYVPKGTKTIDGYSRADGFIGTFARDAMNFAPNGVLQASQFSVPVKDGEDGQLWQVQYTGHLQLLSVPPYLARSGEELLVPKGVV